MGNITHQGLYVNEGGKLDNKAIPLGMTCEYKKCTNQEGNDYKRLKSEQEDGWEDEPIFLCSEHKGNRELLEKGEIEE